jgi:hypothetical protein
MMKITMVMMGLPQANKGGNMERIKPKRKYLESIQDMDLSYLEVRENDSLDYHHQEFLSEESAVLKGEVYEQNEKE